MSAAFLSLALFGALLAQGRDGALAPPVGEGIWIWPAQGKDAEPVWGIRGGIAVGLWPTSGPRGLIRIYAPYLGHGDGRMINYVAVEPFVDIVRGLSELESSEWDKVKGKRMWATDEFEESPEPGRPERPARGKIVEIEGKKALAFFVHVEPFRNGARVSVQVILREDRPNEVGFRVHAQRASAKIRSCILTATMGNYARLRRLYLREEAVEARALWPDWKPESRSFAPRKEWGKGKLLEKDGWAIAAAEPDEKDPASASYDSSVPPWWRYHGKKAVQYWRAPRSDRLSVAVNGRTVYWGGRAPIPGGIAFENFELSAPFSPGQEFWLGVTLESPEKLGFRENPQQTGD